MSDSYETSDGLRIWTAEHLSNKGRCCRSSCLHCPYGHTLKTIGLKISNYDLAYLDQMNDILEHEGHKKSQNIALSLLQEISENKEQIDLFDISEDKIKLIFLKEFFCGFFFIEKRKITHLFLGKHFKFQGINRQFVSKVFFEEKQR